MGLSSTSGFSEYVVHRSFTLPFPAHGFDGKKRFETTENHYEPSNMSFDSDLIDDHDTFINYRGGPVSGCIVYGPYRRFGENRYNQIEAYVDMAFKITPNTYDTCKRRNWKNQCISWDTHFYDHGFTIDLTYNKGRDTIASRKISYIQSQERKLIPVTADGVFTIDHEIHDVEVRVCNLYGGQSFDFDIYELRIDITN